MTLHTLYIVEDFQRTSVSHPHVLGYMTGGRDFYEKICQKRFVSQASGQDGVIFHFKELLLKKTHNKTKMYR
jgi:hypothetical protein